MPSGRFLVVCFFLIDPILALSSALKKEQSRKYYNETVERRVFNFDDLVRIRGSSKRIDERCGRSYEKSDIVNLAVARTGSESLTGAMKYNRQRAHHNHDCTLESVNSNGAQRVIVSLRHPLGRIISGYQRRIEGNLDYKSANALFMDNFSGKFGLDLFLTSLRVPTHALHAKALSVVYGPKRQSYMLPVTEFYLAGFRRVSPSLRRKDGGSGSETIWEPIQSSSSSSAVRIIFICTERLNADFEKARESWHELVKSMPKTENSTGHKSAASSDTIASNALSHIPTSQLKRGLRSNSKKSRMGVKLTRNQGGQFEEDQSRPVKRGNSRRRPKQGVLRTIQTKPSVSPENTQWITNLYQRDIALVEEQCGGS